MKKVLIISALTVVTGSAMAATFNVTGGAGGAIPDNDTTGISTTGAFSGLAGSITGLTSVTVTGLTHTWVGDVRGYLTYGSAKFTLFQHPGTGTFGHSDDLQAGDYTFDVVSTNTIESWAAANVNIPAGTYRAAHQSDESAVVPGTNSVLSDGNVFNGMDPNGTWTLTFVDRASGDLGSFTGWSAAGTYDAVPEPASMLALGAGALALVRRRRSK